MSILRAIGLWIIVCLACVRGACCQTTAATNADTAPLNRFPSATGFASGTLGRIGHAWFAAPSPDGAWLLHVPPRGSGDGAGSGLAARDGSIRVATHFLEMPSAIAAWGRKAWAMYPPAAARAVAASAAAPMLHVFEVTVAPVSSADGWRTLNAHERPMATASLAASGEVLGFVGTESGPAVLLQDGSSVTLWILLESGWVSTPTLPARLGQGSRLLLATSYEGIAIVEWTPGQLTLYAGGSGSTLPTAWTERVLPLDRLDQGPAREGGRPPTVYVLPEMVLWNEIGPDGATTWSIDSAGTISLSHDRVKPDAPYGVAVLASNRRLVSLWSEPRQVAPATRRAPARQPSPLLMMREVSIDTGRELYLGVASMRPSIDSSELRLLLAFLFGVSLVVLLFVLRPTEPAPAVGLPPGLALAPSGPRWLAALIDFLPAAAASSKLLGTWDTASIASGGLATMVVLALGIAAFHCTLAEWAVGKSLGKALVGCEVVGIRFQRVPRESGVVELVPVVRRPRFWQALARNTIRWLVPPLGLEGLGSASSGGRHKADQIARTAVVVRSRKIEPPRGGR